MDSTQLTGMIVAVGALGTAAYGLVDTTKSVFGGVSNAGFVYIQRVIAELFPATDAKQAPPPLLGTDALLGQLRASWLNGVPLADQRMIAKTLIKLRLTPENAGAMAQQAGVDAEVLTSVVRKMSSGEPLKQPETDAFGRFDLILTTALDQAYQRADQRYRNWCKALAIPLSVILAMIAAWALHDKDIPGLYTKALLAGLLATPLAPIAKDVSSAVQAGAKAVQAFKK